MRVDTPVVVKTPQPARAQSHAQTAGHTRPHLPAVLIPQDVTAGLAQGLTGQMH
jgi:hypothetical protein